MFGVLNKTHYLCNVFEEHTINATLNKKYFRYDTDRI